MTASPISTRTLFPFFGNITSQPPSTSVPITPNTRPCRYFLLPAHIFYGRREDRYVLVWIYPEHLRLDLRTTQSRESAALRIINYAAEKEYSGKTKDELLARLATRLGEDYSNCVSVAP